MEQPDRTSSIDRAGMEQAAGRYPAAPTRRRPRTAARPRRADRPRTRSRRSTCRCPGCSTCTSRRRTSATTRPRPSSARAAGPARRSSSVSPAASRSARGPPRASCASCWRAGRTTRGRARHDRRLPAAQRRAGPPRDARRARASRSPTTSGPAAVPRRREVRPARGAGAGLLAPGLRRRARASTRSCGQPDVLIVEGLNVLQPTAHAGRRRGRAWLCRDFFDFSIYVDAAERGRRAVVRRPVPAAARDGVRRPGSYFHRYASLSDDEARETAAAIWREVNEPNLVENILPTRGRATLVLTKGPDHAVRRVRLPQALTSGHRWPATRDRREHRGATPPSRQPTAHRPRRTGLQQRDSRRRRRVPQAQGELGADDVRQPVGDALGLAGVRRLDHDPHERLGAGRPQQHAAGGAQLASAAATARFSGVARVDAGPVHALHVDEHLRQPLHHRRQLGERLPGPRDPRQQVQRGQRRRRRSWRGRA